MALKRAKIQPTINEKRYHIIQFLESAVVSGTPVTITPVKTYGITHLSGENFDYLDKIDTYIILDERPKVSLLQKYGWYREDTNIVPIVAYIPTQLIYQVDEWDPDYPEDVYDLPDEDRPIPLIGDIENHFILKGNDFHNLVKHGFTEDYILEKLGIIRGTLVDIEYDFLSPDVKSGRFYVADVVVDTVSLNYVANLVPYKYDYDPSDPNKPETEKKTQVNWLYEFDTNDY